MLVDAIILTGGRSSRLDGVPKAEFLVEESTLLDRTLHAADAARMVVVVGPEPSRNLPSEVIIAREEPAFGGPAAALSAGMAALEAAMGDAQSPGHSDAHSPAAEAILVLACDMPRINPAVEELLQALEASPSADGTIAVDDDHRQQPLAAVYRRSALLAALAAAAGSAQSGAPQSSALAGFSMFRLIKGMNLVEVTVPLDATSDVDTWEDAARLGATPPATSSAASSTASPADSSSNAE